MAITTSAFAKALYPGVKNWYGKEYNEHMVEYLDLFDKETSKRAYEEEVSISSFGLAIEKAEGSPVTYDTEHQGFLTRYTPIVYALGFIITREMRDDDLYKVVGERRAQGLAFSMRQTKETVGANIYNRAFDSSYTGGDGVELGSSLHPNVAGGTFANELTTPADLSEAALEQSVIDMGKLTNDRGLKIAVRPMKLIVPVDLEFEADRILNSTLRVATANNDKNSLGGGKFPKGYCINHYLTDTDAWFIRTSVKGGMKCLQRDENEVSIDNDFDTENAKFKARERYAFGWTDPRGLFMSEGAA